MVQGFLCSILTGPSLGLYTESLLCQDLDACFSSDLFPELTLLSPPGVYAPGLPQTS